MPVPFVNVGNDILRAYFQGLQLRREQEQFSRREALEKEQLKLQQQREERVEKQMQEQLKLQENAQKLLDDFRKKQIELEALQRKGIAAKSAIELRVKPTPDNVQDQLSDVGAAHMGLTDQIRSPQFTKPQNLMGVEFSPEELGPIYHGIGSIESREKQAEDRLRAEELAREQRFKLEMDKLESMNNYREGMLDARNRSVDAAFARIGTMGNAGTPPEDFEAIIEQSENGTLNQETLAKMFPPKTRSRVMTEIYKRGGFVPDKKWQDTSKELARGKQFLSLMDRFTNSNPLSSVRNLGNFLALRGVVKQNIASLASSFPALGKLTDKDVEILRAGTPADIAVLFFGRRVNDKEATGLIASYLGTLQDEARRAYAMSLKSHFAVVPPVPETRNRFTNLYDLNAPWLGKYLGSGGGGGDKKKAPLTENELGTVRSVIVGR